jgi:hypothetical protein
VQGREREGQLASCGRTLRVKEAGAVLEQATLVTPLSAGSV